MRRFCYTKLPCSSACIVSSVSVSGCIAEMIQKTAAAAEAMISNTCKAVLDERDTVLTITLR